jgi:hypothetical protein
VSISMLDGCICFEVVADGALWLDVEDALPFERGPVGIRSSISDRGQWMRLCRVRDRLGPVSPRERRAMVDKYSRSPTPKNTDTKLWKLESHEGTQINILF